MMLVSIYDRNMFIIQATESYSFYIGATTLGITTLSIIAISIDAVVCITVSVVMLERVSLS